MNIWIILSTALVPLLTGFLWYSPKTFGNAWMKAAGISEEQIKASNMALILGVSLLLSMLLALQVYILTVHQSHVHSLFADMADNPAAIADRDAFLANYGQLYRSFKHGAFHGVLTGIFFVLPVVGINALFERRSAKYIFLHTGYWLLTLAIMGGIICQWA
jgi:hypothetical protein